MVKRTRATIMVLQEEQHPKRSNSGGGGGGSKPKKPKPNKVPQRGLGVAQLEKIRLEEQQKNAAAIASSSSISASPGLILSPTHQPTLPFLPPAADPNPLFRPLVPISSDGTDFLGPVTHHALEGSSVGSAGSSCSHGLMPLPWNSVEPSTHEAEALSRKFGLHGCLPRDVPSLDWRSCGLVQRRQQQQQTSLVNKTLSPWSSGANLQMEPPSNQNYSSNHTMPSSWPEEERVVGMKRSCPFGLDAASSHSPFPCKMPPFTDSFLKPRESLTMHGNEMIKNELKDMSTAFREGATSSSSYQVDWKSSDLHLGKSNKQNGGATDGCFLTLGPPTTPSTSKCKQSVVIPESHHPEDSEFNFLPSQQTTADDTSQKGGLGDPTFYSFLPSGSNTREMSSSDQRGEGLDGLDLNLKL